MEANSTYDMIADDRPQLSTNGSHGDLAEPATPPLAEDVAVPDAAPNPMDPLGIGKASMAVWQSLLMRPEALMATQQQFASAWLGVATQSMQPPSEEEDADHRAGQERQPLEASGLDDQSVLRRAQAGLSASHQGRARRHRRARVLDAETKSRVKFFAKQFCDALSPTNFAFLNPAVIEETLKTGGQNLQRGAQNVLEDLRDNDGRPALVDKKAFEVGRNVATTPGTVVFRNELIELIEYAPTTETVYARPLVIVPPWINKYYILDLQPSNSLIKFAVDSGIRTYVVSWRNPDESLSEMGWKDYLELGPLSATRAASSIADVADVNMIGYCIGGTVTAEMLAYLARSGETLINSVTFLAALTDFEEAGDIRAFLSPEAMRTIEAQLKKKGVLESSEMADTFNMLRANDLIWNVGVNRYLLGKDAPAFDLLYWNGDATRLPAKMHRYYLRNMYIENNLVKPDKLHFKGVPIDLREVRNDVYSVATMEDHIAPWRSVYKMTQRFSGDTRFRLGHSGHIAGIINPPGSGKGNYWSAPSNPPTGDEWLALATKHQGSWWTDWQSWLAERSGERVPAPAQPGSKRFKPLCPAPGTYVRG